MSGAVDNCLISLTADVQENVIITKMKFVRDFVNGGLAIFRSIHFAKRLTVDAQNQLLERAAAEIT